MKLRRLIASLASACVAVSAVSVSAFAAGTVDSTNYMDANGTVYILADKDTDPNWSADTGIAQTDVYGVTYYLELNADEVADEATWIGGGIGANSQSTGWLQKEWGRNEKEFIVDLETGIVTWLSDAPVFAADDTYCQFWLQTWGGTVTVLGADILGEGGVVLGAAAEEEAPADDAAPAGPTFAAESKYMTNNTVFLLAESEAEANLHGDTGFDHLGVYGITYYVEFNADEVADEATWIGGGIGANSNSTGWMQKEWGRTEKEFIADLENGTITMLLDAPIFAADDTYCQLWLQTWGGTVTVLGADLLGADGEVLAVDFGAADEEAAEEDSEEDAADEEATEEDDAAEETEEDVAAISGDVAYGKNFTVKVTSDVEKVVATATYAEDDGDAFNFNDWCGNGIIVTAEDGTKTYYQWGGKEVSWGWDADNDGTEDSVGGVNGETWVGSVTDRVATLEIPATKGSVIEFLALGWDTYEGTQFTISFAGDVEISEAPAAPVEDETEEAPVEDETEEAPVEDEAPAAGEVDAATDSDKGSPDTGIEDVAVVAGLAIVAAGAVLVSKKRK